ncbi:MAG: class Ib ribonucleoside-diphosphate reductase assembly flavoprotein NrdI [Firmicutes bacterium]|nr:class Ib ribonucleoside-diphosphate reductase assembly flavoprotein NrdI [Bacillota bacterium]
MLVVYISKTGKIDRFIEKIGHFSTLKIETGDEVVTQQFILIAGTIGFGEVAPELKTFLKNNHKFLHAVVGSGNKNWGSLYCAAAIKIAKRFNVPLLMKFESAGNTHDIEEFKKILKEVS